MQADDLIYYPHGLAMSYVLIVDDDSTMAQALADMVGLFDWKTQISHGPRQALQLIQASPPSLILLDLNMPGVDGLEVCRYIKRDPVAGRTPVVMVTAEDSPTIQAKAREAGASDYLVKPVDVDRLEVILDKLGGPKPAASASAPSAAKPAAAPPPASQPAPTPPKPPAPPETKKDAAS